jgi:hypothetical protein
MNTTTKATFRRLRRADADICAPQLNHALPRKSTAQCDFVWLLAFRPLVVPKGMEGGQLN